MTQARLQFTSIEDYLNYDDGTDRRYELVNGELIELPAESDLNVQIAGFLFVMLSQLMPYYLLRRGTEIAVSSYTVTSRYPNLIVLTEALLASLEGATRSVITLDMPAPVLVVEIVSPGAINHERDYVSKRSEYAERGISEYWLIDPEANLVTVLMLDREIYKAAEFRGSDRIISPAFGALQLTAEQLLKAGR